MNWFLNASTRAKLLLSFGLMLVLLISMAVTAYLGIRSIQESEKRLFEVDFNNTVALNSLEANLNSTRADTLTMLLLSNRVEQETLRQNIREDTKENDEILRKLIERSRNEPERLKKLEELKSIRALFIEARDSRTIPLIFEGKPESLKEAKDLQPEQNKRYQKCRIILNELGEESKQAALKAVAESVERANQSAVIFTVGSGVAILLGIGLVIGLTRIIATPLNAMTGAAKRIAEGNLQGEELPVKSEDEIGQLAGVFNRMLVNLKDLTRQILSVTQNINSASAEIMASTQQQAAGTKEQAATVQEITTTMEEVSQSGVQISGKAKQVAANAEATSVSTTAGLQAVLDTTRTMKSIREQVEEVAGNIVALSEKTQAVGEIIATVNDIAERSNLLALNAAIEAASAGERGNRFSVVANEMKNLADQAKDSTVQVRNILGEIQKGINTSVMYTEEAVKRVEAGKQQADVAEQTIRNMAKMTLESVQAFEQIIGAGSQQQIGFEQVAQGMKDIRQAAGQTASATAQLETAVANLNALSQELKTAVGRYKL